MTFVSRDTASHRKKAAVTNWERFSSQDICKLISTYTHLYFFKVSNNIYKLNFRKKRKFSFFAGFYILQNQFITYFIYVIITWQTNCWTLRNFEIRLTKVLKNGAVIFSTWNNINILFNMSCYYWQGARFRHRHKSNKNDITVQISKTHFHQ